MKKLYQFLVLTVFFFAMGEAKAQTFGTWGVTQNGYDYDTIDFYGDTLRFTFSGLPAGGWGDARVVIYREGDFGDVVEYLDVYEESSTTMLGTVGNTGSDCSPEDSTDILVPMTQVYSWTTAGVFEVKAIASPNVDMFCTNNRIKARLEFGYCAFGTPVEFAAFSFADDKVCSIDSPVTMVGTPAGGSYSGTGVTGSTFDPMGLSPGSYLVTYTATDGIGCTTSATEAIIVKTTPTPISEFICEGESPVINSGSYVFFNDYLMTDPIDTTDYFVVPPVVTSPTYYYYAQFDSSKWFTLDNVYSTGAVIVDIDFVAGDDRGGYAFTDSSVYITGDAYTIRFDNIDLMAAPVQLPVRDAIFTDMEAAKIYSLYNIGNADMPYNWPGVYTVDAIVALDADLNPTSDITPLSTPIVLSTNFGQNGLFSGYGKVIVKSGDNDEVFIIDIATGGVTSLGIHPLQLYWGENFFDYGVAGFDGSDYYVYYRSWSGPNIVAHNLSTDVSTPISAFSDMSDLAGFMYNPMNNRVYFHYEGSGQFGGSSETFGYLDAAHSVYTPNPSEYVGCPAEIEYTFEVVDLGPDTLVCHEDGLTLQPGLGYLSYTWNGVNNDWNVYPVNDPGTYTVAVENSIGCILTDEIVVTMEWCSLQNAENALTNAVAYPVPNNGNFNLNFNGVVNNVNIQIFDMQGKVVYTSMSQGGVSMMNIDATTLESGMYIVAIYAEEGSQKIPVTIQK